MLSEISQFKNSGRSDAAAEEYFLNRQNLPEEYRIYLVHAFRSYQKKLQAQESLDFDDLIRVTSLSLKAHPEVCQRIKNQVRYLMIDEYQDTNGAQFELIQQLLNTAQNICVVGDDDQSIYAWRGANSDHILSFAQYFKAAKTICLDQNYRSTQHILSAANSVIMNNKHRFKKTLWSALGDGQKLKSVLVDEDRSEGDFVANEIFYLLNSGENKQKRQPKDIAILFRSAPQSRIFEEYLRQKKISYQLVGATSFFDRKEIKDALALLKLLISERDDTAFKRVLLFPLKGIGRTTLSKCIDGARAANLSLAAYLRATPADLKLTAPVTQTLAHYFSLRDQTLLQLGHLSARDSGAISALAQSYFEAFAFFKRLQDDEADDPLRAARKVEMVEELLHALGQFRPSNEAEDALTEKPVTDARALVSAFIQSFQLDPEPEEKTDPDKNQVTLLTLHGAKGLEWPVVFMVGTEEGLLPHRRSLEGNHDLSEERRLCYVGITRAKELIYCTRAHQRLRYGKTIPREESRFLKEIPAELKEPLDVRANAAPIFSAEKHETEVKDFFSTLRKSLGTGP